MTQKKKLKLSKTAFLGFKKPNIVFLTRFLHSSYSFIPQDNKTKFENINMQCACKYITKYECNKAHKASS